MNKTSLTNKIHSFTNLLLVAAMLLMSLAIPTHSAKAAAYSYAFTRQTPTSAVTNADTVTYYVTFSTAVANVDATDFAISGTTATLAVALAGGNVYSILAENGDLAALDGDITVSVDAASDIVTDDLDATPISGATDNTAAGDDTYTIDNTAPTLVVTSTSMTPTYDNPINFVFTFSEDVTGFDASDVTVTNGTAGILNTTSALLYDIDVTPTAEGDVIMDIALGAGTDAAGNNSTADSLTIVYDITAPTVAITSAESPATNLSPFGITITFDEDVNDFLVTDLVVTNGTADAFVQVDSATYTADITPTAEGDVDIDINADIATDNAGNLNIAATTLTVLYDITSPTVDITSVEGPATNLSPFGITIAFSEDVTGFDDTDLAIVNGTASNFVAVDGANYTADITPTAEGDVTIDIDAAAAVDDAANDNLAALTLTVVYDITSPDVVISSLIADPTNTSPIAVDIAFTEMVSGFDITDIVVTNGTASNFVNIDDASYSVDITPTADGLVDVDIAADSANDAAGNGNTEAVTFSIEYDTTRPTVLLSSAESDPTNVSPVIVNIEFSETITGLDLADLTVTNGTADNLLGSGSSYTVEITPTAEGAVTVDLDADTVADLATNGNDAAPTFTFEYDITPPTAAINSAITSPTNDVSFGVQVHWSEPVNAFMLSDIDVTNGHAGAFSGSGADYTFTLTPAADGIVTVTIPVHSAKDVAGNHNTAAATFTITFDETRPSVAITNPSAGHLAINFSEAVTGFALTDITAVGATVSNLAGSGASYTADYAVTAATSTFDIAENVAEDSATNGNTAATQLTITNDAAAPTVVSIIRADANPTKANSVRFTVTFSENVKNVDSADFALATTGTLSATSISSVSGSNAVYVVTAATGTGTGTIGLNILAGNNIADLANNALGVAYTGTNLYNVDRTVPTATSNSITVAAGQPFNSFTVTFAEDLNDPAGNSDANDVTNPANYLLVNPGVNRFYDTASCQAGVKSDDLKVVVNSVSFNHSTFVATINVNNGAPLPTGNYRLFLCGTTSITDLVGNHLNGGQDTIIDFVVNQQYPHQPHYPPFIPHTGFGMRASLPASKNSEPLAVTGYAISIPSQAIKANIVVAELVDGDWNLDDLGNNIGLLSDSAQPGSNGNSILTGHIYNIGNLPGPFIHLKNVKVGENILVNRDGKTYTFVVRSSDLVDETDTDAIYTAELDPWLTLVTCETYNSTTDSYTQRRVVRAELVSIQ